MSKKRHAPADGGTLTHRQREFVRHYAAGKNAHAAALAAGYSPASARAQCYDLLRHPQIRMELEAIAQRVRDSAVYDAAAAMARADELQRKAEAAGQYTAAVKAFEQKNRLAGLLIERQEIKVDNTPNVAAVLAEMRARRAEAGSSPRLLPMCDPALIHDAQFTEIPSTCEAGASDNKSVAPYEATEHARKIVADETLFEQTGGVGAGRGRNPSAHLHPGVMLSEHDQVFPREPDWNA